MTPLWGFHVLTLTMLALTATAEEHYTAFLWPGELCMIPQARGCCHCDLPAHNLAWLVGGAAAAMGVAATAIAASRTILCAVADVLSLLPVMT